MRNKIIFDCVHKQKLTWKLLQKEWKERSKSDHKASSLPRSRKTEVTCHHWWRQSYLYTSTNFRFSELDNNISQGLKKTKLRNKSSSTENQHVK